jgi:glycosyltransferase involved in cell wall biosynthesis
MPAPGPAITFFDPSGTAHSGNAFGGLVPAARALGLAVSVHAPTAPPGAERDPEIRFTPAHVGPVLPTRRTRVAHRRALVRALADADGGLVCDLGLGRTLVSRGPRIPATPRSVFVCHQTNAIDPVDGTRRAERTVRGNRAVLRDLGARGARVIAHTEVARARVAELVPEAQVHLAGWPVVSRDAPSLAPGWQATPEGVTVLFAGSARIQKGLGTLLAAAPAVAGFDRIVVPGRLPDRLRAKLPATDARVELWDRWLDPAEYGAAFASAALVVLPYQRAYLDRGTYSSVLAEAMAYGRPLLVSEPLAPLLPQDYRGAMVVDAETPESLAAGLTAALAALPALTAAAMDEGREHVRQEHTYEGYLDAIRRAGADAAPARSDV